MPLIESIGNIPSKSQIDSLVVHTTHTQQEFSDLLETLIQLAKRCNALSEMEGFMKDLMNVNTTATDCVKILGKTYVKKSDSIKIDDDFYLFFKTNEKELLKDLNASDWEEITEHFESLLATIKKKVIPYMNVSSISRENRRNFIRTLQKTERITKRVKVKETDIVDMKIYAPAKLLPIIALMEETLSYVEKTVKRRQQMNERYGPYRHIV